jgi:hypothetical protein
MEVEEEYLPNLASMLEVSLVEGAHTLLPEGDARSKKTLRFGVVTAIVLVNHLDCYAVSLGEWSPMPYRSWCLPRQGQAWKMKASRSLEWWGTSHPATLLDVQGIFILL